MAQLFLDFIQNATVFQKGAFLMAAGVCFVFSVQLVFYLLVKLWPKGTKESLG